MTLRKVVPPKQNNPTILKGIGLAGSPQVRTVQSLRVAQPGTSPLKTSPETPVSHKPLYYHIT
jgi:hypothetical protein